MKKTKRVLTLVLSIAVIFSLFAGTYVFAADTGNGFTITSGVLEKYTGTDANVTVPAGVTEIGDNAFASCAGVITVVLPSGVTKIGNYAFIQCSNLKGITIPNTVTSIGNGAFANCTTLHSITIPDSVTTFGNNVFPTTTVIYGSNESAAHNYAKINKINFRETGTTYPISSIPVKGSTEYDQLENAVKTAYSFLNKNMNEFEKAQVMHDYLVLNTKYDYDNYLKDTLPDDDFSAYGVLVKHIGVCSGYASAYAILMNLLGIETLVVTNDTHAWNLVLLNGKWYHVDTTWDDPVPDQQGLTSYDYFVISDSKIKALPDHANWTVEAPAAPDTEFDNIFWGAFTHEDFNTIQTPTVASVSLDTSSYKNTTGSSYKFLAKTNIGEFIYAEAADGSIVEVGDPEPDLNNNGWLISIKGLKAGTTTINVRSACGATASFPVTYTNNFTSDTNGTFSIIAGNTYQFMITAPSRPTFKCGSGSFQIVSSSSSGNRYYYKVKATGRAGEGCGFYVNGIFTAAANIITPPAYSDTNGTFSITTGNIYQFMITSSARPDFACGSSSIKIISSSNSGNRYYYRVQAVGKAGDGCGFYVNGKPIAVANIIPLVSTSDTTGSFSVKQGNTYQFMVTSNGRPSFACGSGCFTLVSSSISGNKYYFKVKAVGKINDGCGFYLNGKAIAVAHVA